QICTVVNDFLFLQHQLELFRKLCQGRNCSIIKLITEQLGCLSWQECFICLTDDSLPDQLRSAYCRAAVCLHVDIPANASVLDRVQLTFASDDLTKNSRARCTKRRQSRPILDWVTEFLDRNRSMVASDTGRSRLLSEVFSLLHHVVNYGYYSATDDIKRLLRPLLKLIDGRSDIPMPETDTSEYKEVLQHYLRTERYRPSRETRALVDAKLGALKVAGFILHFRFNVRISSIRSRIQGAWTYKFASGFRELFVESSFFTDNAFDIVNVLLDLSRYAYPSLSRMSLWLLHRYYSAYAYLLGRRLSSVTTPESVAVHRAVQLADHQLRRLVCARMSDRDSRLACEVLDRLCRCAFFSVLPAEPRHRGAASSQSGIVYNSGVVDCICDFAAHQRSANPADSALVRPRYETRF
uniref:Anaphase-promoting complex subunit 2 n=1 Tax=Macrostomum lignano TaxID=282301 RepID=A0A1I8F1M2_9PLAT